MSDNKRPSPRGARRGAEQQQRDAAQWSPGGSPAASAGVLNAPKAISFPQKLFTAISEAPDTLLEWSTNGRAFCIHSPQAVEQDVLPLYFPSTKKYSSLTRKLNRWGFRRTTPTPPFTDAEEHIVFHHVHFQRGRPELLARMTYKEKHSARRRRRQREEQQQKVSQQHEQQQQQHALSRHVAASSQAMSPAPLLHLEHTLERQLLEQELFILQAHRETQILQARCRRQAVTQDLLLQRRRRLLESSSGLRGGGGLRSSGLEVLGGLGRLQGGRSLHDDWRDLRDLRLPSPLHHNPLDALRLSSQLPTALELGSSSSGLGPLPLCRDEHLLLPAPAPSSSDAFQGMRQDDTEQYRRRNQRVSM